MKQFIFIIYFFVLASCSSTPDISGTYRLEEDGKRMDCIVTHMENNSYSFIIESTDSKTSSGITIYNPETRQLLSTKTGRGFIISEDYTYLNLMNRTEKEARLYKQ